VAYAYPSGTNTWIPSWEATGQTIAFIRDPKRFPINNYVKFRPATKTVGLYLEFDLSEPGRSLSLDEMGWADGGERPNSEAHLAGFEFKEYRAVRRDLGFALGDQSVKQAQWPIMAFHSAALMQKAMTALTRQVLSVIDVSTNWPSAQTATVEALIGSAATTQYWDNSNATPGDNNYMNIKKTFNEVAIRIKKATFSTVQAKDLWCVVSPGLARQMGESAEIVDFLKQSPFAMAQVRGEISNRNVLYGLPEILYGVNIVVEDTVYVSSPKNAASETRVWAKNDDQAIFLTKQDALPGDQVGDAPVPDFSTFQVFYYSDRNEGDLQGGGDGASGLLTVESLPDVRNKRTEAHVTWQTSEKLVAPSAGFLVTDCSSTF
jgi:hypothetical protein